MSKLLLIDGNSIMNRAFYGIMSSKMLTTTDGTYTNAVYGFLAILFKVTEEFKPEYIAVTFDLKGKTKRHELYEGYKANRKGMPEELRQQMPIIKDILRAMNIAIIEKEGYEGDDIIGTLSKMAEKQNLDVIILSGDRDTFQLASDKITIHIPRTKMGKTEVDDFDKAKVIETYGVEPIKLIEVKGLMGDTSDNIPGVPGIGEKTALTMIKEYGTIKNIYEQLENEQATSIKGKTREKLIENKDLAFLSKELGTINTNVPLQEELPEENLEPLKSEEWDNEQVLGIFKELKFNRYIERFHLKDIVDVNNEVQEETFEIEKEPEKYLTQVIENINKQEQIIYYLQIKEENPSSIINKSIESISIWQENKIYEYDNIVAFKEILENIKIQKISYHMSEQYILLKEMGISLKGIKLDEKVAAYLINPTSGKYDIQTVAEEYTGLNLEYYMQKDGIKEQKDDKQNAQLNLFEMESKEKDKKEEKDKHKTKENAFIVNAIAKLKDILLEKIEKAEELDLLQNIETPLVPVLAQMQYNGMYVDKKELTDFGDQLKEGLEQLTKEIHELAGEEFNIKSTQQLGQILFEKLNLTSSKKRKTGYATDVETLEKIRGEHPIVEKILDYRSLTKLNSTYVEGLIPYINANTGRIHSYFHQTVTTTGRISSSEPNLQNIPTRIEFGKRLRKVFKPKEGYIYIDADYSQIELRVLAHMSQDRHMLKAFRNGENIHAQAASKVLGIPIKEVTKEQRSRAKAVNFGIVYGISDYGLSEQIGTTVKEAKEYIEEYLKKYSGIKKYMDNIVKNAKEQGYVETLFHRRRYIPELQSTNYLVRQFGTRAAMNTPVQGTAADIMKIAMITLQKELEEKKIDAKIVLQVHDELILETKIEQKEEAKQILKNSMENAIELTVPLEVEVSEAQNWYEAK